MKPYLIGVAGLSGSGKTALARQLAPRLDSGCEVITLDSYYHAQHHLSIDKRASLNFDHPDALDWPLLMRHLEQLHAGQAIEEPHYLFEHHTRAAHTRHVAPQPFLILEGILTLHRAEICALLDLKVYVTTRPEECLRRRLERDIAERGRTRESVVERYQKTVWPMALKFVLPSRESADLVVSGEEPLDESIAAVLRTLEAARSATA
jgi:uridine kinase